MEKRTVNLESTRRDRDPKVNSVKKSTIDVNWSRTACNILSWDRIFYHC